MLERNPTQTPLVIWRLLDGKPGHEHQSQGLVQAMQRSTAVRVYDLPLHPSCAGRWAWLSGRRLGAGLPVPDVIVGAGHQTHLPMLAAQRRYGGKTVCLMQPSLPVSLFDVCLIPEHDAYQGWGNFIETRGVLNHIHVTPATQRDERKALLLIGGPCRHFVWDTVAVVAQISELVSRHPGLDFVLTTSRRTPASFVQAIQCVDCRNLTIVPYAQTDVRWVERQLAQATTTWVTEDSVSMIYESLTAQAAVGLINLPARSDNRVVRGVRQLVDRGIITRYDTYGLYRQHLHSVIGFNEAQRCSALLLRHLWQPSAAASGRLVYRLA